jgi:hypothetical protein
LATWLLRTRSDPDGLLVQLSPGEYISWRILDAPGPGLTLGDAVFFWREGFDGGLPDGVLASGVVAGIMGLPSQDGTLSKAAIRVDQVASNKREVIQAKWLPDDPCLSRLAAEDTQHYAAVILSADEGRRLRALWANTGRDWNEQESLAGLWVYAKTHGGQVSKKAGSPVVLVAERIGRAITGVYNKVMNFRALDPRDPRDGLSGGGQTDKIVWDRYYSPTAERLDVTRIEADFQKLWMEGDDQAGYEPDALVRKAIEEHAMMLAQRHYAALGYAIEDTSANHPFDLRCTREDVELRVEVKGTRASGAYVSVEVTIGEVENARGDSWRTDLFVAWGLKVAGTDDQLVVEGDRVRILEGWAPTDKELKPIRFRFKVPL